MPKREPLPDGDPHNPPRTAFPGISRTPGKCRKPFIVLSYYDPFLTSPSPDSTARFPLPCQFLSSHDAALSLVRSLKLAVTDDFCCSCSNVVTPTAAPCNSLEERGSRQQSLLEWKYKIMEVRLQYGADIWSLASQLVNPFEVVPCIAIPALNRAFFKMWELMQLYPDLVPVQPELLSAHLCEGPGGFIQSLLVYRSMQRANGDCLCGESRNTHVKGCRDAWFSITLAEPPNHHDSLTMDLLSLKEYSNEFVEGFMHYGADQSGDITNPENISSFVQHTLQKSNGKKMHLVTGDGAFDMSDDFSLQEQNHAQLLYCEMMVALQLQCCGGSFVLKLFDCFSESTATIVRILVSLYTKVEIVRLRTSRVCNSERYLVAQGYLGMPLALEHKLIAINVDWHNAARQRLSSLISLSGALPSALLTNLDECNVAIANEQIEWIAKAVMLAQDLGEKLLIIGTVQSKHVVSTLRRRLKELPRLKANALSLCRILKIPLLESHSSFTYI